MQKHTGLEYFASDKKRPQDPIEREVVRGGRAELATAIKKMGALYRELTVSQFYADITLLHWENLPRAVSRHNAELFRCLLFLFLNHISWHRSRCGVV